MRPGEVVGEPHRADVRRHPDCQRRCLDRLAEQAGHLTGDERSGAVGILGEQLIALAAPADRGQQALVVPEPVAQR